MAEVAASIGVTKTTIHNWINSGRLHAVKFEGVLLVPESELRRVLGESDVDPV